MAGQIKLQSSSDQQRSGDIHSHAPPPVPFKTDKGTSESNEEGITHVEFLVHRDPNSTDPLTKTNSVVIQVQSFESGTPEEYGDFRTKVNELFKQKKCMLYSEQLNIYLVLFKGKTLKSFKAHWNHKKVSEPPPPESISANQHWETRVRQRHVINNHMMMNLNWVLNLISNEVFEREQEFANQKNYFRRAIFFNEDPCEFLISGNASNNGNGSGNTHTQDQNNGKWVHENDTRKPSANAKQNEQNGEGEASRKCILCGVRNDRHSHPGNYCRNHTALNTWNNHTNGVCFDLTNDDQSESQSQIAAEASHKNDKIICDDLS